MEAVAKNSPVALEEALKPPAPERTAQATRARKPFLILGAVAAATLLCIAGYVLLTAGHESTDDAQVEADVVPIAARVAGQVLKVHAAENQQVKKGELLIELDDAETAARVLQSEAELDTAQAQAQAADSQAQVAAASARGGFSSARAMMSGSAASVSTAAAQVAAARAGLARADADAHKAAIDLRRMQELRQQNVVAQSQLDDAQARDAEAQAALQQARANLDAANETHKAAESRVGEAQGKLDQSAPVSSQIAVAAANARLAHARVKGAEAQLALAKLQLSYTKIAAQEDGTMSRLAVHEGQLVSVGQPMAALVPLRTYLVANFKETQVGKMKPGQKAEIGIDAFGSRKLEGHVESISGGTGARFSMLPPDNASGNFVKVVQRVPVRIAWDAVPADLALRAGLSADVTVTVK